MAYYALVQFRIVDRGIGCKDQLTNYLCNLHSLQVLVGNLVPCQQAELSAGISNHTHKRIKGGHVHDNSEIRIGPMQAEAPGLNTMYVSRCNGLFESQFAFTDG